MFISTFLLSLISLAACASVQCTIQFDGRVREQTPLGTFDTSASLFNPKFVFGQNLSWSEILLFPTVPTSLFDKNCFKAVEVTLSDASIFAPSPTNVQNGFRRAELLPVSVNGSDPSTLGVKTLHFSLMKDDTRPLNLSHEYQLTFLESADFSTNQIVLKTGRILGGTNNTNPDTLMLFGNVNSVPAQLLFQAPFLRDTWHNFGLILNFVQNTTQVLYSTNNSPLANVTNPQRNDLSGQGQYHFGVLKKPIGNVTDVAHQGFQETGINEGITYGGIFMEDSANGCVSLS